MEEAQISESAYVWTNSKNLHLEWDPEALCFDAIHNRHYGKMVNDNWSKDGNNCMIKWNPLLRRAEVWSLVDVPLYKELVAAYNDPYWYRPHNGITTRAQAVQIRDYYNKTELPPYGYQEEHSVDTQAPLACSVETREEWQTYAHELNVPQFSIIEINQGREDGNELPDSQSPVETPTANYDQQ
jgi:hypothetical protein